ncbi:MAG: ankyrin repeat domain-containing protein [Tahibacter sp.]
MNKILIATFCTLILLSGAGQARRSSVADLVAHVKTVVENGSVDPDRDLQPLLDTLRATRDEDEQRKLVDVIGDIGAADGSSPAAVKAWFVANAPAVLFEVAQGKAGWAVRGDAIMTLRDLDASDADFARAIEIANADTSPQKDYIRSRGELLTSWQEGRSRRGTPVATAKPTDAGKEQGALAFLRQRRVGVSLDSLTRAASEAQPDVVEALLDAGVDVNGRGAAGMTALNAATQMACAKEGTLVARQAQVIDTLIKHGLDINATDERGNTALISAVQSCPVAVIEKMLAVGAKSDPANMQDFTPLKMALVSGHWDIAEALISKGARITSKDADQLFFEKPQDPAQRAILNRGIKK